jgi:hypothetical protein
VPRTVRRLSAAEIGTSRVRAALSVPTSTMATEQTFSSSPKSTASGLPL